MNKKNYLTGKKFYKLTLIKRTDEKAINGSHLWECKCDCGTINQFVAKSVIDGLIKSCGCVKDGRVKNRAGQKFNRLTFIKLSHRNNKGRIIWELLCDCGNKYFSPVSNIIRLENATKSCGCLNAEVNKPIDRTGKKLWRLTFIELTDIRSSSGDAIWKLECECGELQYSSFSNVKSGNIKSCGCLLQENRKDFAKSAGSSRQYAPEISSARYIWQRYSSDGLDFDTFLHLSQQNCKYCDIAPHRTYNVANHERRASVKQKMEGDFTYNGLDRIDSSKGHIIDNVVPCCYECNWMKSDLSIDDFFGHIRRIYEHQASKTLVK